MVKVTRLDNGLRVASDAMPSVHSVTVGVWVDAGARDETAELNGISHLLEHMAFKGTERRSAIAIAEEIEAVGGHLNAYTSREHTAYHARVLADDVPLAVDLLADILRHSVFDAEELERERGVVEQEIAQVDETPDDLIFDLFQDAAYPAQAMGRSILGTAETLGRMDRATLRGHLDREYTAERMILVGAGAIDHDHLVDLADQAFGTMAANGGRPARARPRYAGGEKHDDRDLEQLHLVLGFDGPGMRDDTYYATQVLSTALGGGMSSRLFQEVREKRGLAYAIQAFASCYLDGGLFGVYAGCDARHGDEVARIVVDQLGAMADAVDQAELGRAKAQLKAGMLMALESSAARAEQIARHLLVFDRVIPVPELVARVDAVAAADVAAMARAIGRGERLTLTTIGPRDRLATRDELARRLG
ncbi:MAG: insulinase family protein [Alphaproteobacteria bacterium]|nr:insulinase family protein [Alphaproteobacteria bacterium]